MLINFQTRTNPIPSIIETLPVLLIPTADDLPDLFRRLGIDEKFGVLRLDSDPSR
jgi:hypothetical protein